MQHLYLSLIWIALMASTSGIQAQYSPSWYIGRARALTYVDLDSAEYYVNKAIEYSNAIENDSLLARSYLARAGVARLKGDFEVQRESIRLAEALTPPSDTATFLDIANLYGLYHWKQLRHDSAIYYYGLATHLAYAKGDSFVIARSSNNAGIIFQQTGQYEKAIETYKEGLRYIPRNNTDTVLVGWLYNNLSIALRNNGEYEESLKQIETALATCEQVGATVQIQYVIANMGATLYRMGRYTEAEVALLRSRTMAYENDLFPSLTKVLYHLAEVYIAQGKYRLAENLGQEILSVAKKYHLPDDIKFAHEILYLTYSASGQIEKALMSHEKFKAVEDSLYTLEHDAAITRIDAQYKSALRELKIKDNLLTIQNLTNKNQLIKTRMWFALAAALLLLLLIWLYLSRLSIKRQRTLQETYTQKMLVAIEHERKTIASELHDEVGQKLSMLKFAIDSNDKKMSGQLVAESLGDIRKVSRELYPWQIEKLGIKSALEDLIQRSEEASSILLTYEIEDVDDILDRVASLQIYRIIQECLTNVMRHSEARSGRILLEKHEGRIDLTIQDNGKGFDFEEAFVNSKSLGLQTLIERVKQLKGSFDIESAIGNGSKWSISIPIL